MNSRRMFLAIAIVVFAGVGDPAVQAQNVAVRWSAVDAGAGILSGGNAKIVGVVGQPLLGTGRAPSVVIVSGFLADTVFRFRQVVGGVSDAGVPLSTTLLQNYPNPFNPSTTIRFQLAGAGMQRVSLIVYDILGREVRVLVNDQRPPGAYRVVLNADELSSGVYFYRLRIHADGAGGGHDFVDTKKLMLIR